MELKKQNGCSCSPLSSNCRNPFCSFKPSRALLTSFPNATTIPELVAMRREIDDRVAQDKKSARDAAKSASGSKSTAAAASADDAPGGFAMTKSGPKPPKKKGGSKTCKRKHRKSVR
jgi:hypothetical protein